MKNKLDFTIESTTMNDVQSIQALYQKITSIPDRIIRRKDEITKGYINDFLTKSLTNGISLKASKMNGAIIGEIHAYTPHIYAFQHLLTDLTIMVDPAFHGRGIGRSLFETFLTKVQTEYSHIYRVELYVREQINKNVQFYKSLGFINEGRQEGKIFMGEGMLQTPLHMVWFNPSFK